MRSNEADFFFTTKGQFRMRIQVWGWGLVLGSGLMVWLVKVSDFG